MSVSLPAFPAPPASCGILGLLQAGGAFASTAMGAASAVQSEITAIQGLIANAPAIAAGLLASVEATLMGVVSGAIRSLMAHVTAQLSALVGNLSIAVAHLAAQAGLAGSGGGCSLPSNATNPANDPCFNMSKLFGSILGAASPILDAVSSQLNQLTGMISSITSQTLGAITAAIGGIMGAITGIAGQITGMIASEIAALTAMVSELLDFSTIGSLFGLLNNTCAKQVLGSVATPAMASALGL
jgi:phage-related protein